MTREEAIKKLKGSINLLVEVCHFATDSILCEELEDVIKYLEIDLNNAEKLHKPTKYEPLYYAKIKGWQLIPSDYYYFGLDDNHNLGIKDACDAYEFTKAEWAKLGITDENADFERVEE